MLLEVFSRAYKDKSGENVLKGTGETITFGKQLPERREQLQEIARNLTYFYETGPGQVSENNQRLLRATCIWICLAGA